VTPSEPLPRRLGDFLRERHDEIVARWETSIRRLRPARLLPRPALLDHMPDFLREIADYVSQARDVPGTHPPRDFPNIHAIERLDLGYDLSEVVLEYGVLRNCIAELAVAHKSPSLLSAEMPLLHEAIDLAVSVAVTRFSTARERMLKALDRISTAALAEPEVDAFLPKILSAVLESTPAVDSASVLLVEGNVLRVRAALGFALPPEQARPLVRGECLAGKVWEAGQPLSSRDPEHDSRVTSETIRRHGTRAMYGVPLHFGSQIVGVAVIGSCSAHEFSHEDQLLFRTAANRVAALVAQARLHSEVRRQQGLYESVVRALDDIGEGFAIVEHRKVVLVNDALCRIVGRTPEELYAISDVLDLIAPQQRDALRGTLRHRIDESTPTQAREPIEASFLHRNGSLVDVELGLKRKPTGRVVVVVRDISARRTLERERAWERARLDAVLRALPVGVVIAEAPSGKLILGNEVYEAYEGYWPDGRRVAVHEWPLARAIREGVTTPAEEIHMVSRGKKKITEQSAAPVRDDRGEVIAGVVTMVDVTERKRSEEELRSALAFRERILNILAHDLRQPLSVISTSASLLLRSEALAPHAQTLKRQLRNVERMDRLISDLLDYARARQGQGIPLARKRTSLVEVLRQVIETMESLHPDRKFSLTAAGAHEGEYDPDRMLQVFGNLLGNAVSYSPAGSPVAISVREEGDVAVVGVHNQGSPIPKERIASLFEAFQRVEPGKNPLGLGLGLFIVEQIVTAHGGDVSVASSETDGTTFTVRLPKNAPPRREE
jgi:PAS domain S-box-containing protein